MENATKYNATDLIVTSLLNCWHGVGRSYFERSYDSLNYNEYAPKTAKQKQKYIYLDEGRSGVFILDRETGNIFRIKAYGVINRRKLVGNIETMTGEKLCQYRHW